MQALPKVYAMKKASSEVLESPAKPALPSRPIEPRLLLVLLCIMTGCGKHPDQLAQKMAVYADTANSVDNLRLGDNAGYISKVRAEKENDFGFKRGGLDDVNGPGPGSGWNEGASV